MLLNTTFVVIMDGHVSFYINGQAVYRPSLACCSHQILYLPTALQIHHFETERWK